MEIKKSGRPTKQQQKNKKISESLSKMTPERLDLIREAFSFDSTIAEACLFADIDQSTYYNWKKKNPELFEKLEALRSNPVIKAKRTVLADIGNPQTAKWLLERKRKKEYSTMTEVEQVNVNLTVEDIKGANSEDLIKLLNNGKSN